MYTSTILYTSFYSLSLFFFQSINSHKSPFSPWISAPKNEILHVAPEDEKLLQEDVSVTPIKKDGLKRKDRPTDKGMSWLVKTQYISPLTTDATRQVCIKKKYL